MVNFNSQTVVKRYNRPGTASKTLLEIIQVNNGARYNPYAVSSVHIFPDKTNGDAGQFLNGDPGDSRFGQIAVSGESSAVAIFCNSGITDPNDSAFDVTAYGGTTYESSGIYTSATGKFAVVLTPAAVGPAGLHGEGGAGDLSGTEVNGASAAGKYFDIWTIKETAESDWKTVIHSFDLFTDNFISLTEPIVLETKNRLRQKYVTAKSVVNLEVETDTVILNNGLSDEVKNIFQQSVIQDAQIQVRWLNHDETWSDSTTNGGTNGWVAADVLSDDTIVYNWLAGGSSVRTGVYNVQVKYTLLEETIYSDKFKLIVR